MTYILTDFDDKQYEVDGLVERGDMLFATMPDNGDIPIYSIKYDNEFARYYRDHIRDIEDIRDSGPSDNQG